MAYIAAEGFNSGVEFYPFWYMSEAAEWKAKPDAIIRMRCAAEEIEVLIINDRYKAFECGAIFETFVEANPSAEILSQEAPDFGIER